MFIVLEGGECCGKTTLRSSVAEKLTQMGYQVTQTREPGGTEMSEHIREVLLKPREEEVSPLSEALLFFAGRNQHIERVVKPKLEQGNIVICDRFIDSTYALQCRGGLLEESHYEALIKLVLGDFRPDLTIVLDHDPEVTFKLMGKRGIPDRLESKGLEYHRRVRQGFLDQIKKDPGRYHLMQAHQNLQKMVDEVIARAGL